MIIYKIEYIAKDLTWMIDRHGPKYHPASVRFNVDIKNYEILKYLEEEHFAHAKALRTYDGHAYIKIPLYPEEGEFTQIWRYWSVLSNIDGFDFSDVSKF